MEINSNLFSRWSTYAPLTILVSLNKAGYKTLISGGGTLGGVGWLCIKEETNTETKTETNNQPTIGYLVFFT